MAFPVRSVVVSGDGSPSAFIVDIPADIPPKTILQEASDSFPEQKDAPWLRIAQDADPAPFLAVSESGWTAKPLVHAASMSSEALAASFSSAMEGGRFAGLHSLSLQKPSIPFLQSSSAVVIDREALGRDACANLWMKMRQRGVTPVAGGIRSHHDRDDLSSLGVGSFEGPFVWTDCGKSAKQDVPAFAILRILGMVFAQEEPREIEDEIRKYPVVAYRLLALINSAAMRPGRQISSIRDALVILGDSQLVQWLSVLLLSSAKSSGREAVALEVAVRARICEKLYVRASGRDGSDSAFLAGIFSGMTPLVGETPQKAMIKAGMSDEVVGAVNSFEGPVGRALLASAVFEPAGPGGAAQAMASFELSGAEQCRILFSSMAWAGKTLEQKPRT